MSAYPYVSSLVIAFMALLHVYNLVLEMFLWDKPAAFGLTILLLNL
jgi:putative membrane protein